MSTGNWSPQKLRSLDLPYQLRISEAQGGFSKAATLSASAGLVSGFVTVWIYSREQVSLPIGGIIFLTGIAGSLLIARLLGWLSTSPSTTRLIVAAALVGTSHPAILWLSSLTESVCELACRLTTSSAACGFQASSGWIGFLIDALSTCVVVVATASLGLWVLTRRWERREFVFLVLVVIGTTWNSLVLTTFLQDFGSSIQLNGQDWTYFATLAIIGESLLALISAHWIYNGV